MGHVDRGNGTGSERVVIGIDPASGKGSYVFSPGVSDLGSGEISGRGIDRVMKRTELRELLRSSCEQKDSGATPFNAESCLVCWDAPLTGPRYPDAPHPEIAEEGEDRKESLTTREIERKGKDSRYPDVAAASAAPGVSICGFSGLSHWVISRHVLGLPRVGRFDAKYCELPLYPVFTREELHKHRFAITEVHPTLAVWMWLGKTEDWQPYKGSKISKKKVAEAVQSMWRTLIENHLPGFGDQLKLPLPTDGDAFDARVAWLLGYLWLTGDGVEVVGTEHDGSFLLPRSSK